MLVAEVLVLVVGGGAVNLENKRIKIFLLFKKARTYSTFPKNQYFLINLFKNFFPVYLGDCDGVVVGEEVSLYENYLKTR